MLEGKYELKFNTPMGDITGELELRMEKGELCGTLAAMGGKNHFKGGKVEGNKCVFSGEFNTPMGIINYNILGIAEGNKLNIYAETNKGRFKLEGTRKK